MKSFSVIRLAAFFSCSLLGLIILPGFMQSVHGQSTDLFNSGYSDGGGPDFDPNGAFSSKFPDTPEGFNRLNQPGGLSTSNLHSDFLQLLMTAMKNCNTTITDLIEGSADLSTADPSCVRIFGLLKESIESSPELQQLLSQFQNITPPGSSGGDGPVDSVTGTFKDAFEALKK